MSSTVQVSDNLGSVRTTSNHFQIADAIQLGFGQLGDGLFPLKGSAIVDGFPRNFKDLNGETIPGVGLSVSVRDYLGMIGGAVLTTKNAEQFSPSTLVNVPLVAGATSWIVLTAARVIGDDGFDRPDFARGVISAQASAPASSSGVVALSEVTIPAGATQVSAAMIDNSVRIYLTNIDTIVAKDAQQDSRLVSVEGQISSLQSTVSALSGNVSTLNAQAASLATAVSAIQSTVSGLSSTVALQAAQISALQASSSSMSLQVAQIAAAILALSGQVAGLSFQQILQAAQTAALSTQIATANAQIASLQASVASLAASIGALAAGQTMTSAAITALSSLISGLSTALASLQTAQSALQTTVNGLLAQGLANLSLSVAGNIALVNFKIDSLMNANANALFNGFSDGFHDLSGVDAALSSNYIVTSQGLLQAPPLTTPTTPGFDFLYHFDGSSGSASGAWQQFLYSQAPYSFVSGVFGQAMSFGVGGFAAPVGNLPLTIGPVGGVSAWVNPGAALTNTNILIIMSRLNGSEFARFNLVNNVPTLIFYAGGIYSYMAFPSALAANQFTAVGFTWSLSAGITTFKMYAAGALVATFTTSGSMGSLVDPTYPYTSFMIHETYENGRYMDPLSGIDELAIYSSFLPTDAQMLQNASLSISTIPGVIVSKPFTATVSPSKALSILKETGAISTDIAFDVSRDGGTTWTSLTPASVLAFGTQPAGTQMRLRATLKTAQAILRAWSLWWA